MRNMMTSMLAIGAGIGAAYMMSDNNMKMNRSMKRVRKQMKRALR
ncbi:YrzQ family protein [Bacillus solimangrovi]|nr:YrzQ family protein [Bacillus solimangrovi]